MKEIVDFLTGTRLMDLVADPRFFLPVAVLAIAAVIFRWKPILLAIFGIGGVLAVIRYTRLSDGGSALDQNFFVFIGGILAVAVILIYFLFIRGD